MGSLFIRDGYTERGYISEDRVNPALRFKYRPLRPDDVSEFQEKLARQAGKAAERFVASTIAPQIVEWDLVDEDDKPVPVSPENFLCVRRRQYDRVCAIVLGHEAGDVDPLWAEAAQKAFLKTDLAAKANGVTEPQQRTVDDAKN